MKEQLSAEVRRRAGENMNSRKKVAIFTIQDNNYGNRLQNYAVQECLNSLGFEAISLKSGPGSTQSQFYDKPFVIHGHRLPVHNRELRCSLTRIKQGIKQALKREYRPDFDGFIPFIHYGQDYIGKDGFKITDQYQAFIAGSDQIWNPDFETTTENSFLPFEHPNKIALSASFGVNSLPYDQKIADCLNDFKALSVREVAGADIISKLTGRKAEVLIDPTMLLNKDQWREIAKKPMNIEKEDGYILTYFLSPKCREARDQLENLRGNRRVYELLNPKDPVAGRAGPCEFVWLFDHADLILTDSFHACVFSFLFNKPFIVYDRNWENSLMNSRLETFTKMFGLERKYASSGLDNNAWEHNYQKGYARLDQERAKAIDYLQYALNQ
ncbi:polysaccharide pyruvyl transferase family protein [Erysipelotrichaceae bacterium 51-3]